MVRRVDEATLFVLVDFASAGVDGAAGAGVVTTEFIAWR